MKIISKSHVDSHAALLQLVESATAAWEARLAEVKIELEEANAKIRDFDGLPWYKRWFKFFEPCNEWETYSVRAVEHHLKFLQKVKHHAQYEMTIMLDDNEANTLFYGSK